MNKYKTNIFNIMIVNNIQEYDQLRVEMLVNVDLNDRQRLKDLSDQNYGKVHVQAQHGIFTIKSDVNPLLNVVINRNSGADDWTCYNEGTKEKSHGTVEVYGHYCSFVSENIAKVIWRMPSTSHIMTAFGYEDGKNSSGEYITDIFNLMKENALEDIADIDIDLIRTFSAAMWDQYEMYNKHIKTNQIVSRTLYGWMIHSSRDTTIYADITLEAKSAVMTDHATGEVFRGVIEAYCAYCSFICEGVVKFIWKR